VKLFKNIFSIFFILAINAQQTSTISGFVRDNATGEPLSYVNVFVVIGDSYKGSATNQDGYYVSRIYFLVNTMLMLPLLVTK